MLGDWILRLGFVKIVVFTQVPHKLAVMSGPRALNLNPRRYESAAGRRDVTLGARFTV